VYVAPDQTAIEASAISGDGSVVLCNPLEFCAIGEMTRTPENTADTSENPC
jgi:hypothetical protein